ncbi:MAG: hypothetical protein M1831_003808 [Alyxoria varia]|nr:MAG: hypothetical protein M1831_003808 [Alyxoria varia]
MAETLFDLLQLHTRDGEHVTRKGRETLVDSYTSRLCSLSVEALNTSEPEALHHEYHSSLRSLQALAKRSHKSINTSADSLQNLDTTIPRLASNARHLQSHVPEIESSAMTFAQKYSKPLENAGLERRRHAMVLGENSEKISDILELPALLSSTIAASAGTGTGSAPSSASSATANYASALDLYGHIKRLQRLYPESAVIRSIISQAEDAMRGMTTNLISSLRSQTLKLAGAMRLVGLVRRVAPELDDTQSSSSTWTSNSSEGSLGALFLVCRLANLTLMLEALDPLKELADQETAKRLEKNSSVNGGNRDAWAAGQQTERYLKRYIEVFREQCFAIVSMCKSVFPTSLSGPGNDVPGGVEAFAGSSTDHPPAYSKHRTNTDVQIPEDDAQMIPSALSTFIFQLVDTLSDTLREYLPNILDRGSRDSLLTQVLYCAGSLGRLGGDFGMVLSTLHEDLAESEEDSHPYAEEWIEVMKRHRVQAGRLELLASGVGGSKSKEISSVG